MKIILVHKNTLEKEPPTQMVLQHLSDIGHEVEIITLAVNDYWEAELLRRNIKFTDLGLGDFVNLRKRSLTAKVKTWFLYRRLVLKALSAQERQDALIWFVDADAIAPLLFSSALVRENYIFHVLEMYDHSKFYKFVINKYAKIAKRIVVCEKNRAAIFNVWFDPPVYPAVLPNKPYSLPEKSGINEFLESNYPDFYNEVVVKKKKIILYQGVVSADRDLSFILKGVNLLGDDFVPVIMGRDYGMLKKYREICPRLYHISYIPSPHHLVITSLARMGILMYDPISLNQIFCAPNKIFEYSGYGIPMIGNNIPGLAEPLAEYNCGRVFNCNNSEEIRDIILDIDANFDFYSQNSQAFFNSVNNRQIIENILNTL